MPTGHDPVMQTTARSGQAHPGPGLPEPALLELRQHTRLGVVGVWAAAALPMAALAWLVAPAIAEPAAGDVDWFRALALTMTAGLVWQGLLVAGLVLAEQQTLRWSVVRRALWLTRPTLADGRSPRWLWWLLLPLSLGFAAEQLVPSPPFPESRDLGSFLGSDTGRAFLEGSWGWFGVLVVMVVFNTVLGEELLFRGWLLPRMQQAFGRADWVANGVLFATYHLHMPWAIPAALLDTFWLSWASRRFRSAWFGIIVHSMQSVVILVLTALLVAGLG